MQSMVSCFQVMTSDGWTNKLLRPYKRYGKFEWWEHGDKGYIGFFFAALIILCNYALMKVLIGAVVTKTLTERKNDESMIMRDIKAQEELRDKCSDKVFKLLRKFFQRSAKLRLRDVDQIVTEQKMHDALESFDIHSEDIRNTVCQIPPDEAAQPGLRMGAPNIERMRAILRRLFALAGEAKSSEVFVIASKLRNCIRKVDLMMERVRLLTMSLEMLDERISPIDNSYTNELNRRTDSVYREVAHIRADLSHKKLLSHIERMRVRKGTDEDLARRSRGPAKRSRGASRQSAGRRSRSREAREGAGSRSRSREARPPMGPL